MWQCPLEEQSRWAACDVRAFDADWAREQWSNVLAPHEATRADVGRLACLALYAPEPWRARFAAHHACCVRRAEEDALEPCGWFLVMLGLLLVWMWLAA